MKNVDSKNIPLGNFENKVIYYNVDSHKFYSTCFNKDTKKAGKIGFIATVILCPLLVFLNSIVVFKNISFKIAVFMFAWIMSVEIAKKIFKLDNPEQTKAEFYKDDKTLNELLISWKKNTVLAMAILTIDIILTIVTAILFFQNGSVYSLFFFSGAIMFFEVGNFDVLKRYKILNLLINEE